ncbi:MAG: hypothetical protein PHW95_02935 [Patescibacteria group bacterium]|nr:hypothetical protein [Patescibacteria group bacterium]
MKNKILALVVAIIFVSSLVVFLNVRAQSTPTFCGDGVIQSPNKAGQYEKCDDGNGTVPIETDKCTTTCGAKLMGFAWSDNVGWVSLNDKNCEPQYLDPSLPAGSCGPQSITYYTQATNNNEIQGYGWSDNVGWVCFGTTCPMTPPPPVGNLAAQITSDHPENPAVTGWAKILSLNDNGWVSLSCLNDMSCNNLDANGQPITYQVRLGLATFGTEQRLTLSGFSWNNLVGWLEFNATASGIPAWLQTKYGDIYARRGLQGLKSPGYNATYRILSSSGAIISDFTSQQGADTFWISPQFGPINFPTPETRYSNVLGKLDVDGILCSFNSKPSCNNQFGKTVVDMSIPGQGLKTSQLLDGKIYYYNGNLTINNPVTFLKGGTFENAAGTIIIDGDLTIKSNIFYDNSDTLSRFINLPSVAWIVRGDIKIDSSVKDLAGNFIVIGKKNAADCSSEPNTEVSGCGQIYSCFNTAAGTRYVVAERGAACSAAFKVSGLMMAKKFYFDRTYKDLVNGSELIIYDGRLLANTPPGLTDFAKALPIWRSDVFAR